MGNQEEADWPAKLGGG